MMIYLLIVILNFQMLDMKQIQPCYDYRHFFFVLM